MNGLLYFIIKIDNDPEISKDNFENENEQSQNWQHPSLLIIIFEQLNKNRLIKAIKSIIIIALISVDDIIQIHTITEKNFDIRLFFLIFTSFFSVLILKKQIYKHQKISLIASTSGIIIALLSNIIIGYFINNQGGNYSLYVMLIFAFVGWIIFRCHLY